MSKYDWERGTIKLPAKEYARVRRAVMDAYNQRMAEGLRVANRTYDKVKILLKGKRGIDTMLFIEDELYREELGFRRSSVPDFGDDADMLDRALRSMFPKGKGRMQKPKKKDFPLANARTQAFAEDDAFISFNPKDKTVLWEVDENNRAVERARNSTIGKALFRALHRVEWTARTGGTIYGNDEYHREEGDGSNYVAATFGKDTPKRSKPLARSSGAMSFGLHGRGFGYGMFGGGGGRY